MLNQECQFLSQALVYYVWYSTSHYRLQFFVSVNVFPNRRLGVSEQELCLITFVFQGQRRAYHTEEEGEKAMICDLSK